MPIPAGTSQTIIISVIVGIVASIVSSLVVEGLKGVIIQSQPPGAPQSRIKVVPLGIAIGILCALLYALVSFLPTSTLPTTASTDATATAAPTSIAELPQEVTPINTVQPSPTPEPPKSTATSEPEPPKSTATSEATLTADAVLELLTKDDYERSLVTARPLGRIGWVVDTKLGTGQPITFYYPGRGQFDYNGPKVNDDRCKSSPYMEGSISNWHFDCAPHEFPMPFPLDGVSWYPEWSLRP